MQPLSLEVFSFEQTAQASTCQSFHRGGVRRSGATPVTSANFAEMRPRFGSCGARYWKFISSIVESFGASTWDAYMSTRSRTHGMRLPFAVTMRPASSLAGFDGECVPGSHSG